MKEIKKIDVMSCAKLHGLIFAVFGIFIGLIVGLFSSAFAAFSDTPGFGALGFSAVLIFPILYGIIGFVTGIIIAALYNIFAGWIGGIKVELLD